MTQVQGEHEARHCPRCGGRMVKPAGSTLFWHADNNHPRCDITNLVDSADIAPIKSNTLPAEPPESKKRKSSGR